MEKEEAKLNFIVSFFLKLSRSKKYSDTKDLVRNLLHTKR